MVVEVDVSTGASVVDLIVVFIVVIVVDSDILSVVVIEASSVGLSVTLSFSTLGSSSRLSRLSWLMLKAWTEATAGSPMRSSAR